MRHGKKFNHLGRKSAHRKAMLANMACSLIEHKRINTTLAKAKALKQFVEPLVTKSKEDTTHNRRIVFSKIRDKYSVTELFREVATKVGDRPGGYTRIIKLGNRLGDNADMAMIELVDYNETYNADKPAKKKSTRRSRSSKKAEAAVEAPKVAEAPAKKEESDSEKPETSQE
ncbi:50S ribosomal protein L17 [Galbibacter sp. BG1]|uniref:50S ribosomal protein L17 n=1 Tax=Galbibacter sp. BG1 TaxID=1170699 RepID=UPI0015BCDEF3|nr:50S ribosomal protein L17 [Galbibacter sp. BG1]QLE00527.1 50S ribosomal protein L17 [Galbibacter sp. BG1]